MIIKSSTFQDSKISRIQLLGLFSFKCFSCFFYVWVYAVDSSKNLFNSDTQSIMHDANIIYGALSSSILDYLKIISGCYDDSSAEILYEKYFKLMEKWTVIGNNDFMLNDNRGITRINAVIMLFSFGKYEVHALFMAFMSFVGQWFIFKSFKNYFEGKEHILLLVLLFIPSLYFWTGGVLKEAIVIFLIGLFVYSFIQIFINRIIKWKYCVGLIFSFAAFFLVKPYVLLLLLPSLFVFCFLSKRKIRFTGLIYVVILCITFGSGILITKLIFKKDFVSAIVKRQNDFVSTGYGGMFFYANEKYVRMDYNDLDKIKLVDETNKLYSFKPHVSYIYWKYPNFNDTIRVKDNTDTLTVYPLINTSVPSNSAITKKRLEYSFSSFMKMIPLAFVNTFCKPFFVGDRNKFETFASFENLLLFLFVLFCFWFADWKSINWNLFFFLLSVVLLSYLLIGLTTTISGAIVRYKVPFLPFLWMFPLMLLNKGTLSKIPFLNLFKK